jgi:hypothetical protein
MHLQQYIVLSRRSSELDASGSGELDRPERFLSEVEAMRYAENLASEKTGYDDRHRYSFVMFIDVKPYKLADGSSHLRYVLFRGDWPLVSEIPIPSEAETS